MRRRRRSTTAFLLLLVFAAMPAIGQDDAAPTESSLFRQTIAQDIATAGFYDLVSWLELLGLSTRGDREALAERLYSFYEVPESQRNDSSVAEENPPIVVDSASRTSYFTLEETDERYIRLTGGVSVTLRDDEQGAVHTISADEVVFNQDQNTVAATGDVVYLLERAGTTEQFVGDALTVELDTWEGAFVQGVSERERTIEGEAIDFSFTGQYITRSRDDVIVLDAGRITSSEADPPNYEIRASKIWVLAPGEWGLRDAVLYVGRVPIFYFPFFFRPGDDLFFNPALGTREREGAFIQTTSYLVGQPPQETSAFSFLQLADEGTGSGPTTRSGLFLVPDPSRPAEVAPQTDFIKLIADVYTKLGALLAIEGALEEVGSLQQVEFYAGLAATRHIYLTNYPGAGAAYTPFLIEGSTASQSWNEARIGSVSLPFRFGLALEAERPGERLTARGQLDAYSDPSFTADFGGRSEQIDWLGLVGQGETIDGGIATNTLLWQLDAAYNPDVSEIERISTLSLQRALIALNWRSREIDTTLLPFDVSEADGSPESSFYYPDSLRLPELTASIAGTLLSLPAAPSPAIPENDSPPLRPPWEADESEESFVEDDREIAAPPLQPSVALTPFTEPFTANVGYRLAPTLIMDQFFYDELWDEPEDVDFRIAYGGASARASGSTSYSTGLASDLLRFTGSLSTAAQYRSVFARDPDFPDAEWETLEQQAWEFRSLSVTNNLSTRVLPLRGVSGFSSSSMTHTFNTLLYRISLDEIVANEPTWQYELIEWDEQFIQQHRVDVRAQLDLALPQSLTLSAVLPPLDPVYSASLSTALSWLTTTTASGIRRPDEEWLYDPLTSTVTLQPAEWFSLSNALSYDIEAEELAFSRTTLGLGPLSSSFEFRTSEGFEFGGAGVGWQGDGDRRVRPTSATLSATVESPIGPSWRNRIAGDINAGLAWNANLLRYTESSLRLSLSSRLVIHEFAAMALSFASTNNQAYVYIPSLAEGVGREPRNAAVDLLRSFNFFNRDARIQSGFNLETVRFDLIHDLGDWELTVGYGGSPELITATDGSRSYDWRGLLEIGVRWRPISELSSNITIDDEEIRFDSDA